MSRFFSSKLAKSIKSPENGAQLQPLLAYSFW
jgi:hypothetical protein